MADEVKTLADTENTFQFATIENLDLFKTLLQGDYLAQIDKAVAPALKTVSQSADGLTIFFYTKEAPVSEEDAAFSVTLPGYQDISRKADKVDGATEGHLAGLDDTGNLTDSGYAPGDFDIAGAALDIQTELLQFIGSIPMDSVATTIVEYIQEAVENGEYDDTELREAVNSNTVAIDILNGVGEGSVRQAVLDGLNEFVEGAPESLDTYKELCDWILNHESDAAAMNSAIHENAADIEALKEYIGTIPEGYDATTIVDYIAEIVTDIIFGGDGNIYAKQADLDAAVERIDALETNVSDLTITVKVNSDKINDLTGYVGTIPASSAATTIVEYIQESINSFSETIASILTNIDTLTDKVDGISEGLIQAQEQIQSNTEAIDKIEAQQTDLSAIPEEDIRALFDSDPN